MPGRNDSTAADLGLLALRVVSGGLMAGHGAQKLFGAFGGHGLEGTGGWLESLGLKPGRNWAMMAGGSEFASGVLIGLGLGGPLGPIALFGPMTNAWLLGHAGKPIWVTSGGAELPLTNMAIAAALALAGPGRYSLDEAFDIEVHPTIAGLAAAGVISGVLATVIMRRSAPPEPQQDTAQQELQSQGEAESAG